MRCRKNIRKLIHEYNAASPADKPTTALMKFRQAILNLKTAPSRLPAPHTQANRYDDYVYIHQQSMAGHPAGDPGPHPGHRGPASQVSISSLSGRRGVPQAGSDFRGLRS